MPSSDVLWILSEGYLQAADAISEKIDTPDYVGFAITPCIFSYFRCIELALKSVLVDYEVTEKMITKTLGHRISELVQKAEEFVDLKIIGISQGTRTLLDEFSSDYARKWYEYPDGLWSKSPNRTELKDAAHTICESIKKHRAPQRVASVKLFQ